MKSFQVFILTDGTLSAHSSTIDDNLGSNVPVQCTYTDKMFSRKQRSLAVAVAGLGDCKHRNASRGPLISLTSQNASG